jgi:hypothetical protein
MVSDLQDFVLYGMGNAQAMNERKKANFLKLRKLKE